MYSINDALALWIEEEGIEEVERQLAEWREKAEKSYEGKDLDFKFCYRCNQLMRADSMAYHEGYHFDSCI